MKSNYLENMIMEMNKKTEITSNEEIKNIEERINKLNASWKRKYTIENKYLPVFFIFMTIGLIYSYQGIEKFFIGIPFIMLTCFVFIQAYRNNKIHKIDLSLSLTQYGNRQYQIYRDQIILLTWFKRITFTLLPLMLIWELAYRISDSADIWAYITILIKTLGLGGIYYYIEGGIKEVWTKIENLQ